MTTGGPQSAQHSGLFPNSLKGRAVNGKKKVMGEQKRKREAQKKDCADCAHWKPKPAWMAKNKDEWCPPECRATWLFPKNKEGPCRQWKDRWIGW